MKEDEARSISNLNNIYQRFREACDALSETEKLSRLEPILEQLDAHEKRYLTHLKTLDGKFLKFGWVHVLMKGADFLPVWIQEPKNLKPVFETSSSLENLLDPMEIWFARTEKGWLSIERRDWKFVSELQHASPFFSEDAARSACSTLYLKEAAFCKASMLFSKVLLPKEFKKEDVLAAGLAAGCEAKEIDSDIQSAADGRREAMNRSGLQEAPGALEARPKARL